MILVVRLLGPEYSKGSRCDHGDEMELIKINPRWMLSLSTYTPYRPSLVVHTYMK